MNTPQGNDGMTVESVRGRLQERRCKRCGRMLHKMLVLVDGAVPRGEATRIRGQKCVEIFEEPQCPKCGYKNFFHDKY